MLMFLKKIIKSIIKRTQEALAYFYYSCGQTPSNQVRVVIFAQGRTGSTLLENLICSTGHFQETGELLNTEYGEVSFPLKFIHGISKWKSHRNFIFHVKTYQLTRDRKKPLDPETFLRSLYNAGFKIIYIRRENVIRHCLSNLIAKKRGTHHKFDNRKENLSIAVNCKRFIKRVKERIQFGTKERTVLSNLEYHEVVYEDDLEKVESHQVTVDKILDYLSLEKKEATTKHKKVNTVSMRELISNYREFIDCMSRQGWQDFID